MLKEIIEVIDDCGFDIGLYVTDLNGNEIKYNENKKFEAASCIKLFILIEYFKQVNNNIISQDDTLIYEESDNIQGINSGIINIFDYGLKLAIKDYANLMILYSDNIATNKLINLLGIDNINKTIKELGLVETVLFNKLDLLNYHKFGSTTAYEYAITYKKIIENNIVNETISKNILDILKKQPSNDMLKKMLPQLDVLLKGTDKSLINYIASKSGTIISTDGKMKNARNDGGIVSTKYGDYIIAIFVSNIDDLQFNYDNKGITVGASIHKIVFDNFVKGGNLIG